MGRVWDKAESGLLGLHVQGPQGSFRELEYAEIRRSCLVGVKKGDGLIEQQTRFAPVQGSCAGGKRSW